MPFSQGLLQDSIGLDLQSYWTGFGAADSSGQVAGRALQYSGVRKKKQLGKPEYENIQNGSSEIHLSKNWKIC